MTPKLEFCLLGPVEVRRVLGDADQARIVTQPPGYTIRADPGELDVARFEVLRAAGGQRQPLTAGSAPSRLAPGQERAAR